MTAILSLILATTPVVVTNDFLAKREITSPAVETDSLLSKGVKGYFTASCLQSGCSTVKFVVFTTADGEPYLRGGVSPRFELIGAKVVACRLGCLTLRGLDIQITDAMIAQARAVGAFEIMIGDKLLRVPVADYDGVVQAMGK